MKREALIRELRKLANKQNVDFQVIPNKGKGSHYRVIFGDKFTTIQSGELDNYRVTRIKKQLGIK